MPPPSSERRTNSLAFAKTDCHTCTANQRRCDRKRPRCSSCSGRNVVCGGYPMQLTCSRSKPIQPRAAMFSEQIDDPFYLEHLSTQASIHVRDMKSRTRPLKSRKLTFIPEKNPCRKQTFAKSCQSPVTRSSACLGESQSREPKPQ
jgi:hypothetical protein